MNKKKKIQHSHFERDASDFVSWIKARERIDAEEIDRRWNAVAKNLETPPSRRAPVFFLRRSFRIGAAAAVIGLLVGLSGWLAFFRPSGTLTAELLDEYTPADSIREIALLIADEQIRVADNAAIRYDKDGAVQVNRRPVETPPETPVTKLNRLVVPKGRRTHLTFSDGTRMYVNAGTQVIYPPVFAKEKREILVEGEVYLEVAHNPEAPFIVKTGNFDVKVVGTVFNVCAYREEKEAYVVLVNGRVEVDARTNGRVRMEPDQLLRMNSEGMHTEQVDVARYISWKDNALLLEEDKIGDVALRLSRYYGVPVACADSVREITVSGKLDLRNEIGSVLNLLTQPAYLHYDKKDDDTYYIH